MKKKTHFFQIVGDVIDTKVGIVGDVFNYALGVLQGAANLVVDTVKAGQNRKSVFIDGRHRKKPGSLLQTPLL